jgi:hypothetical protein
MWRRNDNVHQQNEQHQNTLELEKTFELLHKDECIIFKQTLSESCLSENIPYYLL